MGSGVLAGSDATEHRVAIGYVTLQNMEQGDAGFTHVHEVVEGLVRLGYIVKLMRPSYRSVRPSASQRLREIARIWIETWHVMGNGGIDALYVRQHPLSFPVSILAYRFGVPVILEINGTLEELRVSWPKLKQFVPLLRAGCLVETRLAAGVVAVTPELASEAKKQSRSPDRVITLSNAANTDIMRPLRRDELAEILREYGLAYGRYVVFVGALARWQGIDAMLEAVKHPMWPRGVDLVVCGSGVEASKIEHASLSQNNVRYLGRVPYHDVPGIVGGSMAGLVPKVDRDRCLKGLSPLKLYEYMACGKPVIASSLPGLSDVVSEANCGILVAPEDPEDLALAVRSIAENPERAKSMGARARKLAEERYSWSTQARRLDSFIRVLIGGP